MAHYERRLPHWDIVGRPLFATFRLHDSLPANRVFPPETLSAGESFLAIDRLLDRAMSGPVFLQRPDIADIVVNAVREGEARFRRYELHAFVVMPNHVHLLVTPNVTADRWLGPLKGFTAHEANRNLNRGGRFWQVESYDHLVRGEEEFERIRGYIEGNPVSAGLVSEAERFPWSSAAGKALAGK